MKTTNGLLSDGEKSLIAMGAAMDAGCRTCAEEISPDGPGPGPLWRRDTGRVSGRTGEQGRGPAHHAGEGAGYAGSRAKGWAGPNRSKQKNGRAHSHGLLGGRNSAPDACREMRKAFAEGVTEKEKRETPVGAACGVNFACGCG